MACGGCNKKLELTVDNVGEHIEKFLKEDLPQFPIPRSEGRGIVICAGGRRLLTNAYVCIRILRMLGCQLPIQVWYLGVAEYDPEWDAIIKPYGVEMIDSHAFLEKYPHGALNGWELKPYSMLLCPWREVILLDADNVCVKNPEYLFDTVEYADTGCIFWPDYSRLSSKRLAWKIFGDIPYRDEPEVESGQIVMDKHRHGHALVFANWVMTQSGFFFTHVHGDKEVFHLCWRKLNSPYSMPQRSIHSLAGTMCQHDFKGERVFQHRNMKKWTLGGNEEVHDFKHQDKCFEYLEDLRKLWDPMLKFTQHLTDKDLEDSKALIGTSFRYYRVGYDDRVLRFGKDCQITMGAASKEAYWWVQDNQIVISGDDLSLTCKLTQQGEFWVGRWEDHEKMPIMLVPVR